MAILENILKNFSPYDHNNDKINEINSLALMTSPRKQKPLDDGDKLLLVIVNSKLLNPPPKKWLKILSDDLDTFRVDLEKDGFNPRVIIADIYSGVRHQDGRIVLAIRKFFQEVRKNYPYFKGAIFIGSFPSAFLVRTYPWRKSAGFDDNGVVINGHKIENQDYLRIWPEIIATRSDIVLCDLDGDWDSIYHEEKTTLPSLMAVPESYGLMNWAEYGSKSWLGSQVGAFNPKVALYEENTCYTEFEDFFHINDGQFQISQTDLPLQSQGKKLVCKLLEILNKKDAEVSLGDKANPNPIATPKIIVSSIDASHVAIIPDMQYPSDKGEFLLDSNGNPQEISAKQVFWDLLYTHDADLEYKLITRYLERNHEHRTTSSEKDISCAAIAGPDFKKIGILTNIYGSLSYNEAKYDPPDGVSVSQYVKWLRLASLIYAITTHANDQFFHFRDLIDEREKMKKTLDALKKSDPGSLLINKIVLEIQQITLAIAQEEKDLNLFLGNKPERWYWDPANQKMCPGWKDLKGQADIHIHKALWASGLEYGSHGGRFYVTDGCGVNSCNYLVPYSDDKYAKGQLAESLLFYVRGLAVIARAKTFNDFPKNVGDIFERQRKPFGEIWSGYFNSEKQDGTLDSIEYGIRRKESYFWGVVGDWTLKIVYGK